MFIKQSVAGNSLFFGLRAQPRACLFLVAAAVAAILFSSTQRSHAQTHCYPVQQAIEQAGLRTTPKTMPAELRLHYDGTSKHYIHARIGAASDFEETFHRTLDLTAILELSNIDYRARNYRGEQVGYTFSYDRSGGMRNPNDVSSRLVSLSGQADFLYQMNHKYECSGENGHGTGTQNASQRGSTPINSANGSFLIEIQGDRMTADADSGPFQVTGEKTWTNPCAATRGSNPQPIEGTDPMNEEQTITTPRFPIEPGTPSSFWTVNVNWTGRGWAGRAEHMSHNPAGESTSDDVEIITYSLVLGGPERVKADPGGPYTVTRGEPLELDGSGSKGGGLSYKWSFTPKGCPQEARGNSGAHKEGAHTTVVLLCDTDITLTVSNTRGTDTKTTAAAVQPRDWQTEFNLWDEGQLPRGGNRVPLQRPENRDFMGGANRCALDPYDEEDVHILHPKPSSDGSWKNEGYKLQQVQDPGGPFDQWWVVSDYNLGVTRQSFINPYILPGGPRPVPECKPFYEANKELHTDVDGYIAAVRAHEGMQNANGVLGHSGLLQKALPKNDPGPKVEQTFRRNRDDLQALVDDKIHTAERALCNATKDPLPLIWSGQLAVCQADSGRFIMAPLTVGGPGFPEKGTCK